MNKLTQYLDYCSAMYYKGSPVIADEVFDALAEAAGYNTVGAKQHEDVEKHVYRMYSLQKFYEDEGKKSPLAGFRNVDMSPKIDGAAVSLLYIDGQLVRALTRGDGIEGTVITDKFVGSALVPQSIPVAGVVQITGELAAPNHVENARNYAAGSLSLKDINEFRTRAVNFFAYGVQPAQSETFTEDMQILKVWGFDTIKDPEIHKIYPCDGVVFRVNKYTDFFELGYTAKFPRGAYAKKERNEAVETTLVDVVWQVGKSGKVSPVGILEPIMIGDAQVSRASLHNIAFIRSLDLHIGDTVGVVRSGDIIPQVTHKVE